MNKQEQKARKICALCNWGANCKDCPQMEYPSGKCLDKPKWDYKACKKWRYYLENPVLSKWRRFLCWIGLHQWYNYTHIKLPYIHRKCTRCGVKQEYLVRDNDYRNVYWRYISDKMM